MTSAANQDSTNQLKTAKLNPLVSVIIPTYNRASLLMETLVSLRSQPYRPLEVIIVNDGSTDDTRGHTLRWIAAGQPDSELRCHFVQQENKGAAAARNRGQRLSTGRYIHFLDSDDVVGPHFYKALVSVMENNPDCAFAWGDWNSSEDATTALAQLPDLWDVVSAPSLAPPNNAWCGLYRKAMIPTEMTWNEALQNHNDWDYTTRFLFSNPKLLIHLPAPLLVYRTHAGLERLGRIRTPENLQTVLNAVDNNARLLPETKSCRHNPYANVLAQRFSAEYITLLFNVMESDYHFLKKQAACGVVRHATYHQNWFWNLVAFSLLVLLPISGTILGKRVLRCIRRRFGDTQLTKTQKR